MTASRGQLAGGAGWLATVGLLLDMAWDWTHPSSVATLQAQYSESLKIIAEACQR